MPGYQRCHLRLKTSVQGLENNVPRHRDSLAMQDAFLAHYKLLLLHTTFPSLRSFSDSPYFAVSTSHFLSDVVRTRNVELRFPDRPKIVTRHSGVSYACLLVPVVRHSPPSRQCKCHRQGKVPPARVRRAPRREHRRGYFLLPPRVSRSRRRYYLPRRSLDAQLFTVLGKITHIFFFKVDSELNVNSSLFH